jgi:hypothetical protein
MDKKKPCGKSTRLFDFTQRYEKLFILTLSDKLSNTNVL